MRSDSLIIRTPEGIDFALPLAGPFSRMLALTIDLAVILTAGMMLQKLLAPAAIFGHDFAAAIQAVVYFAFSLIYAASLEWMWRGQTIGKRLLHLRVMDAGGLHLEPAQIVVRNLLRFIDALPALYLVGGAACVLSRKRRRLGDIAAGTVVIRVARFAAPEFDPLPGAKYNSLAAQRHLAARLRQKVAPETARLALDALLRRDHLTPAARLDLFAELAAHFRTLVPYPAEAVEQLGDEQYVRDVIEILYPRSPPQPVARSQNKPVIS